MRHRLLQAFAEVESRIGPVYSSNVDDRPTRLWELEQEDNRVACQVRLVPYGIEVDILSGGRVILTRTFETDTEALAWADEKRLSREQRGYQRIDTANDDTGPVA